MEQKSVKKVLRIGGMTCSHCEMKIENELGKMDGILSVKAIYGSSNVYITYDANVLGLDRIIRAIEALDYKVLNRPQTGIAENKQAADTAPAAPQDGLRPDQWIGIGLLVLALYIIINNTVGFNFIPQINQSMGYGILFAVGLLTSLHCIAMCGGINLSQCVSYTFEGDQTGRLSKMSPSLMYNAGRVLSYTVIGGMVGALGSLISFSGAAKGAVAILSGIFMVIMGLNLLNIFPGLRKFNPRLPKLFGNRIYNNNGKHGPFYIGLLNGLMPCGPLQAMQLYALGTGSFFAGAASMFLFSLGTVPLMFGFGAVSSFLSSRFTHKMMKVSAVLVIVLGIVMVNRGLSLSGVGTAFASSGQGSIAKLEGDVQVVTTTLESGSYAPIVVQKGIPVKWTVKAEKSSLNGCNNALLIPKYGIQKKLAPGDNVIEFTPEETGNITYTCWMGMIRSNIGVVDDINTADLASITPAGGRKGCCGR